MMGARVMNYLRWSAALVVCGALSLAVVSRAETNSLHIALAMESLLDSNGAVWKMSGEQFMAAYATNDFVWVSGTKDAARSVNTNLTFEGLPVFEAIARFKAGMCMEFTLSLFNRGDVGDVKMSGFERHLTRMESKLTDWAGSKAVPFKEYERTPGVIIRQKAWVKAPHRLDLTWSITQGVRPEYLRLQIVRFNPADPPRAMFAAPVEKPKTLFTGDTRSRISRNPNGDLLVTGVPMVDQGDKGYCAAAVLERLLRFFGRDTDQHEIAQLIGVSATRGTSPEAIIAALNKVSRELDIEIRPLQDFNYNEYSNLIRDYNQLAGTAQKAGVTYTPTVIDAYKEMDADVLKKVRTRNLSDMTRFKMNITKYVNFGIPLTWAVVCGKVAETPAIQGGIGGHLRIIIGYNERTGEVLYTDTWGEGHELKRMTLADAWTITIGLYTVAPRSMRF